MSEPTNGDVAQPETPAEQPATPEQQPAPANPIRVFKEAAARVIIDLSEAARLADSHTTQSLGQIGIKSATTTAGQHVTVSLTDAELAPPLPSGIKDAADLTPAKIASLQDEYLLTLRHAFHAELKRRHGRNEFKLADVIGALREMGYAEDTMPHEVTDVSATLTIDGKLVPVAVQLTGRVEVADARTALEGAVPEMPGNTVVRAAFGDQLRGKLPSAVDGLYADTRIIWPAVK